MIPMQAKKIVLITAIIILVVVTIILTFSLFIVEKQHKENIVGVYNECCEMAQEALYNYLNTDDESYYEQLCDNIYAMTNIALVLTKEADLRQINNDLIKSYSYLIDAPTESVHYLDFLNEALILYVREGNVEGLQVRLQSFNNRVQQEIKNK